MTRGRFITLDGLDGSGKTTQLRYVLDFLRAQGKSVHLSREPGGTPVGEAIRTIFKDPSLTMHADSELLLLMAARCEHLRSEIYPRLARGEWVVSDRFNDATYAYQGSGRGMDEARIRILEKWIQEDFQADCTFILQLPLAVRAERMRIRNEATDRMEAQSQAFFARVQKGYEARAARYPHVHLIDGDSDESTVFARIRPYLEALL